MNILSLDGSWTLTNKKLKKKLPAQVPGVVHTDLQKNRVIGDLFYRDNEEAYRWIDKEEWKYTRTFSVPASLLTESQVLLHCKGLDTFATIHINGKKVGTSNNQHRTWEYDVKKILKSGKNEITVTFAPTWKNIEKMKKKRSLNIVGGGRIEGGNYIRKAQYQYGWDWGPVCVTAGIWRSIEIHAFSGARLLGAHIIQKHKKESVTLEIEPDVELYDKKAQFTIRVDVSFQGERVGEKTFEYSPGKKTTITVDNPQLWWPNDMGEQHLYDISVSLENDNKTLDSWKKRIGLRTMTLNTKKTGKKGRFEFIVNGVPFFAKGANWIPSDAFITRVSNEQYKHLLTLAKDAHMNMMRVWGGGVYEPDVFYDLCDELGLCVWQDFMFACSAYPIHDKDYIENVKVEFEQNIKRIRHHASLALWCGNNELEQMWADLISEKVEDGKMTEKEYLYLFDEVIPQVLSKTDPVTPYWPSSAHTPIGNRKDANNPDSGDAHLWEVWHGREPFEWYRTCEHSFNSEFGFQAFPEPQTVDTITLPEDRNVNSYIMEKHQKSFIGNDAIMQYMMSWYQLPKDFSSTLFLSQILQGMAIKYAVEHWRRKKPHGTGTLYWQLNDCWQVASWSSIDYFGNKKGLHYMAKKFFAPVLLSGWENMETGTVDLWITNDDLKEYKGVLHVSAIDTSGKTVKKQQKNVTVPAASSAIYMSVDMQKMVPDYNPRSHILLYSFEIDKKEAASNVTYFSRPKHVELEKPNLQLGAVKETKDGFTIEVKSDKPALWVWLDIPNQMVDYSDRFFHLFPGKPVTITVRPKKPMTAREVQKSVTVSSLYDTYANH